MIFTRTAGLAAGRSGAATASASKFASNLSFACDIWSQFNVLTDCVCVQRGLRREGLWARCGRLRWRLRSPRRKGPGRALRIAHYAAAFLSRFHQKQVDFGGVWLK